MASFISREAPSGWYPSVGERVVGENKKLGLVEGTVAESYKHPGRPAVFSRHGFVGLYIDSKHGQVCVIEVRPANKRKTKDTNTPNKEEIHRWQEFCRQHPLPEVKP